MGNNSSEKHVNFITELEKSSDIKDKDTAMIPKTPFMVSEDSPDVAELFLLRTEFKHSGL